jgi:exonuclease 1
MHRVRLLRHHKIQPYIVFDGGQLPAKRGTEADRRKKREENLRQARDLEAKGKHSEARECYVKCVDITPQMAYQVIKVSAQNRYEVSRPNNEPIVLESGKGALRRSSL